MKQGTAEYTLKIERETKKVIDSKTDSVETYEKFRVEGWAKTRDYDGEEMSNPFEEGDTVNKGLIARFYEVNSKIFAGIQNLTRLELRVTEQLPVKTNEESGQES